LLVVVPMGRCSLSHSCSINKLQGCTLHVVGLGRPPLYYLRLPSQYPLEVTHLNVILVEVGVPMEHNCENSRLTLLCWFRNMQITLLRVFRQYQNQSWRVGIIFCTYTNFALQTSMTQQKFYHSRNGLQTV
jgi:hypothetical protein